MGSGRVTYFAKFKSVNGKPHNGHIELIPGQTYPLNAVQYFEKLYVYGDPLNIYATIKIKNGRYTLLNVLNGTYPGTDRPTSRLYIYSFKNGMLHSFNDEPSARLICKKNEQPKLLWHKYGMVHRDGDRSAINFKKIIYVHGMLHYEYCYRDPNNIKHVRYGNQIPYYFLLSKKYNVESRRGDDGAINYYAYDMMHYEAVHIMNVTAWLKSNDLACRATDSEQTQTDSDSDACTLEF